jgi:hypothetical protein
MLERQMKQNMMPTHAANSILSNALPVEAIHRTPFLK